MLFLKIVDALGGREGGRQGLCVNMSGGIKDALLEQGLNASLLSTGGHWTVLVEDDSSKILIDGAPLSGSGNIEITDVTDCYQDFGNMPLINGKPYIKIKSKLH